MSKKLLYLISFVLVLALAGTNVVFADFVWESRLTNDNDDIEEEVVSGNIDIGSSDLEIPYEGTGKSTPQIIGIRFPDVAISQGAEISNAYLEFVCDEDKDASLPVSLIIEGDLSPDAPAFTGSNGNISARATTTTKVVWVPETWSVGGSYQTSNFASVIEEIVGQGGWVAGNSLVLIIRDDPDNPSEGIRTAEAGPGTDAVFLRIEYRFKYATEPNPADGGTGGPAPLLQWTKGSTAVYHDVYFGTSPELGPDDLMERMPFPMYWHIPGLTPGTTYYWRVDEVEADGTTIHTGNLWSFFAAPLTAHNPDPFDGSKTALPDEPLTWGSGATAATHDVYFGTNRDDVAAGTADTFKGNQLDETYAPEGLENGTPYYWRIDELEADGTTKYPGEVWSFKTFDDPAFIGWWKFDEGLGGIAYDSSGFGHHGILGGNQLWVTNGAIDGALELDGSDDYVAIDAVAEHMVNNNFTVSAWIKSEQQDDGCVFASNFGGSHDFIFGVDAGRVMVEDGTQTMFGSIITNNQWHMITYVRNGAEAWIYVDGVLKGTDDADDDPAGDDLWSIGQEWDSSPSDEYEGIVDDARFWIRPLSAEEVAAVFKGDVDLAHSPVPANNSTSIVGQVPPLGWSPGENAAQHDVYFGTDEISVGSADASDTAGIYRGRQSATSYSPSEPLEWGSGPYYWRIDEYNTDSTISTGKVWTFTVADFLLIDDIEDYNDYPPNEIYTTWIDGYGTTINGATAGYPDPDWSVGEHYVETSIVHGGGQSMPLFYDNNFKYSEATMTLTQRNWTREGVGVLSLWFQGDAANAAERMYVALNSSAVVYHDNPNAAQIGGWTEWTIDLQEFAAQGVNLANVNTITIGFGDKNNLQAGGSGMVFFDDIRLYRPAP